MNELDLDLDTDDIDYLSNLNINELYTLNDTVLERMCRGLKRYKNFNMVCVR